MSGFGYAVDLTNKAFHGVFPDGMGPDTDTNPVRIGVSYVSSNADPRPSCELRIIHDKN